MRHILAAKSRLNKIEKERIDLVYQERRADLSAQELFERSKAVLGSKITRLGRSDDVLEYTLYAITKAIVIEVIESDDVDIEAKHHALVAIDYLCDPKGIIHDSHPEDGYLDDAYVYHIALTSIKKCSSDLYKNVENKYQSILEAESF